MFNAFTLINIYYHIIKHKIIFYILNYFTLNLFNITYYQFFNKMTYINNEHNFYTKIIIINAKFYSIYTYIYRKIKI